MIYNVFSAMANKYSALFLGGFSDAELEAAKDTKERMEICRKRMTESWSLFLVGNEAKVSFKRLEAKL